MRPIIAQSDIQPASVYWFDWSRDGEKIAVATRESLTIYDSQFHLLTFRPQPDPTRARSFASLSPNGTLLATENEIWDTATLKTLFQLQTAYGLGEWNPDGTLISAIATDAHGIVVYDTTSGNLVKTIPTGDTVFGYNPLWSPDGTRLAANGIRKTLVLIDVNRGEIAATYPQEDIVGKIAWSSDSAQIAYSGFAEVKPGTPGSIAKSGSITGAVRNSVYIADASSGQIIHTFTGLPNQIAYLVWSPDNTQLLAATGFGQIYIWDTKSGQLISSFKTPDHLLVGVDFSPFGGQVMMGFNPYRDVSSPTQELFITQSVFIHAFLGGSIQKVVPVFSTEKLQSILRLCSVQSSIEAKLNGFILDDKLDEFINDITSLDKTQIQPACADDLVAVAQALEAQ
ncbi:MAG: hypothetical protein ABI690_30715 [Chloroflexota bacterium]